MKAVSETAILGWTLLFLAARAVQGGSIADSLMNKYSKTAIKHDAMVDLPSVMNKVETNPILQRLHTLNGATRANEVMSVLEELTSAAQAPLMKAINSLNVSATPLWISNDIFLKDASLSVLQSLANIPGEFIIREPVTVNISPVSSTVLADQYSPHESRTGEVQWGVSKIGAPVVWDSNITGEGIVVANIDTGVNNEHEALRDNYAKHWYDPVSNSPVPYDDNGHGTHTMGIICGTTRGIGVAPGAKWVACKGLDAKGSGKEFVLKRCFEWILHDKKANIVSSSWGLGQGNDYFNEVISACIVAGIFPVFSIGDNGPRCSTAYSPGDQSVAFSVGSTTENDRISSFSSRGPSLNTNLIKPDVSAPGQRVLSSYHNSTDAYVYLSGTSVAAPHVAGAFALIRSAQRNITYDEIIRKLKDTAVKPYILPNEVCAPNDRASSYPNHAFGNGRIDVSAALDLQQSP